MAADDLRWIDPSDNIWGVRALDVRPITLETDCFTLDPRCAENALSFEGEDGLVFADATPQVARRIPCRLAYRRDRLLADGVLFAPRQMGHKWALFFHAGRILIVRSWLRQVCLIADVTQHEDEIVVTGIQGALSNQPEDAAMTTRVVDYLIRSHALREDLPAPIPAAQAESTSDAGHWCLTVYGNMVRYASVEPVTNRPQTPLRSQALLHIAAARGNAQAVDEELAKGVPLDLPTSEGLTVLHWALASDSTAILDHLLRKGLNVDMPSAEQATPLMIAAQRGLEAHAVYLLERGANANARDASGYTALHRAAEQGDVDMVRLLLAHGADAGVEAQGHTPLSLAREREEHEVVALLERP